MGVLAGLCVVVVVDVDVDVDDDDDDDNDNDVYLNTVCSIVIVLIGYVFFHTVPVASSKRYTWEAVKLNRACVNFCR